MDITKKLIKAIEDKTTWNIIENNPGTLTLRDPKGGEDLIVKEAPQGYLAIINSVDDVRVNTLEEAIETIQWFNL